MTTLEELLPRRDLLISPEARYKAAVTEIATRQNLRQSSQTAYIATTGLLTWAFGDFASKIGIGDDMKFNLQLVCVLSVPLLGVAYAALMAYHDYIMGLLSAFCGTLERGPNAAAEHPPFPGFQSPDQPWLIKARTVRKEMDLAFYLFLAVPSAIAVILALVAMPKPHQGWIVPLQLACFGAAVFVSQRSSTRRRLIRTWRYDWKTGELGVPAARPQQTSSAPETGAG